MVKLKEAFSWPVVKWYKHFYLNIITKKVKWMGVTTCKNPLDAWVYQEIIYSVKPRVIVEIGSAYGGSTLFFANMLDLMVKSGTVVSIDNDRKLWKLPRDFHPRIVMLTGDSLDPKIVSKTRRLCEGKRTLVIHDGDHNYEHVLADLRAYADMVSVGSYLVVEDGIIDMLGPKVFYTFKGKRGPLPAIEQFIGERDDFVIDEARQKFVLTWSPKGFLRRKR